MATSSAIEGHLDRHMFVQSTLGRGRKRDQSSWQASATILQRLQTWLRYMHGEALDFTSSSKIFAVLMKTKPSNSAGISSMPAKRPLDARCSDGECATLDMAPLDEDKAQSFHIANSNFVSLIINQDAHSELWRAIHNFKLDEVMHDILMREDFLDEPQAEIDDFIQHIAAIVKYLQENPVGTASEVVAAKQRIRKRIPAATQHLWDNRERLGLWLPGHISMEMNPVCHLLLRYAEIGEVDTPYPPAQMGEFLYLHSVRYNSALSTDTTARNAYLRAAIVEGIGSDAFIARLSRELQRPGVAESPEIIGACVAALNDSLLLPEILPYIRKHSILDVLAMILDTYCKIGGVEGPARPILYNHTTYFL
ncbi:hypothetical protein PENSPDRAFT_734617, partial [Peniophora sp. CONT]